jgi:glutathione S-transferase
MSKVTLLQYPSQWGLPNPSPFCFKLEIWMQMVGIDYQVKDVRDPRKTPKGKLPCLIDGDRTIPDSSHIIQYLKERYEVDPEDTLSQPQRAESLAFQRLTEDHLYWVLVFSRWIDESGWAVMKEILQRSLPRPLRWFLPSLVRGNVRKQLHAQGLGRHSPRDIYRFARSDLNALAARIEGSTFFHGDEPTTIDAILLATLANILWTPLVNPMVEHARAIPVLGEYSRRVWQRCMAGRPLPELALSST